MINAALDRFNQREQRHSSDSESDENGIEAQALGKQGCLWKRRKMLLTLGMDVVGRYSGWAPIHLVNHI
jgi:hypothetical protein